MKSGNLPKEPGLRVEQHTRTAPQRCLPEADRPHTKLQGIRHMYADLIHLAMGVTFLGMWALIGHITVARRRS